MKQITKAIGLMLFATITSCQFFENSENLLIKEFYNPRQSMKVIVYERGNATTNNSIHASIEGYDYELRNTDKGNIFIADEFEKTKFTKDSFLLVNWISNELVEINYPASVRIFKIEERFENSIRKVEIKHNSRKEK